MYQKTLKKTTTKNFALFPVLFNLRFLVYMSSNTLYGPRWSLNNKVLNKDICTLEYKEVMCIYTNAGTFMWWLTVVYTESKNPQSSTLQWWMAQQHNESL